MGWGADGAAGGRGTSMERFQLRINNLWLVWFYWTQLSDWSRKLVLSFPPVRCKTKTIETWSPLRKSACLLVFTTCSDWLTIMLTFLFVAVIIVVLGFSTPYWELPLSNQIAKSFDACYEVRLTYGVEIWIVAVNVYTCMVSGRVLVNANLSCISVGTFVLRNYVKKSTQHLASVQMEILSLSNG